MKRFILDVQRLYPRSWRTLLVLLAVVGLVAGASGVSRTPVKAAVCCYTVNAGGSAVDQFAADAFYSGGSTYSTNATIDTSAVSNPAPQAVYQTERYGNFTYTFPNMSPGAQYTVLLHEAEIYWTSSGQRLFNVSINGQQVLTNFDIYATAGVANRAIREEFTATPDANGQIAIQFTGVKDNAKIDGIDIQPILTPTPPPTIYYHLVNRNSGLLMGVLNASTSPGAQLVQWSANGSLDQEWSLVVV